MPYDRASGSAPLTVACAGARFSETCAEVIAGLAWARAHDPYRFVMEEWIGDDRADIALVWIVDDTVRPADLARWLADEVPLLVPESSPELKNLCVTARCGLYYDRAPDAEACLHRLLTDATLRQALGDNGRAYAVLCELVG